MASRLRLNGWRRLWLAASAGLAIWFVAVWPLHSVTDPRSVNLEYHRFIEEEFDSGHCEAFQTATLEALKTLLGTGCVLIREHRIRNQITAVPFTREAYDSSLAALYRQRILKVMAEDAVATAIISGLVYFLGWLVGWILACFRQH